MSRQLLEASGLSKSFGALKAVDAVSLHIEAGECLALLGPNGAGKTTLVEIMEGLQNPDSGSVHIFGGTYAKTGDAIRERIGVVLQETSLYKRFTIKETLQMFASLYRRSVPLDPLIEKLGLTDKANTQIHKLSGGQKQRVFLGVALVNDPELIFLDEPTTGLDPNTRRTTWDMIQQLKTDGRGILLTTHYMEEATYLADRIAIMDAGRIIAAGTSADLLKTHGGTFTFVAKWATPPEGLVSRLTSLSRWPVRETKEAGLVEFVLDEPAGGVRQLLEILEREHLVPGHFELRQATLEDVFIKLTGKTLQHAT